MITIKKVRTKKQFKQFADYPMRLYKNCPYYMPIMYGDDYNILNKKKNANLDTSDAEVWLAYRDGKVVGRIAGIVQKQYNQIWSQHQVRFSRFDCIDDAEVAKLLLDTVADWGKEQGMQVIEGPWDFNDQGREGLLVEGFDRRSTFVTNYAYPYFEKLLTDLGFQPNVEWVEYQLTPPRTQDPKFERLALAVQERLHLTELAEKLSFKQIVKDYGHAFFELVNDCYAHLDGYVPIGGRVLQSVVDSFTLIINPRYFSVITDSKGELVGVAAALSSICDILRDSKGHLTPRAIARLLHRVKHPRELELAIIAVRKDYQSRGVNAVMMNRIMKNIIEDNITYIETNPELLTNTAVQSQWTSIERRQIKRRKCFTKTI